jgi:hypothetical protein
VLLRLSIRRGLIKVMEVAVVVAPLLASYHTVAAVQFLKASTFDPKISLFYHYDIYMHH